MRNTLNCKVPYFSLGNVLLCIQIIRCLLYLWPTLTHSHKWTSGTYKYIMLLYIIWTTCLHVLSVTCQFKKQYTHTCTSVITYTNITHSLPNQHTGKIYMNDWRTKLNCLLKIWDRTESSVLQEYTYNNSSPNIVVSETLGLM